MAINIENIIPQKGFNSLFSLIENCDIIEPPYAKQYETAQLFLKRRDGITEVITESNYIFYDIKEFKDNAGNKYIVVAEDKTTNEVVVFELNGTTLTELNRKPKGNIIDIVNVTGGVEQLDTGTATIAGVNNDTGEGYLIDKNKASKTAIISDISGANINTYYPGITTDGTNVYAVGGTYPNMSNGVFSFSPLGPKSTLYSYKGLDKPTAYGAMVEYNNKLYIIGGINYADKINVFNKSTFSWETPITLPSKRVGATAQVVNGKIYIIGGSTLDNLGDVNDAVDIYDISTNTFTSGTAHSLSPLSTSVVDGTDIYVIVNGAYVHKYDTVNNTWIQANSSAPGSKGTNVSAVLYNGKIYCVYGKNSTVSKDVYIYDIQTDSWTTGASSNYDGSNIAALYNGKIYVFSSPFHYEVYDIQSDVWYDYSGLSDKLYVYIDNPAYYYDGNNIWVVGGNADRGNNTIQKYKPNTDTWESYYSLPFGVKSHSVEYYGGDFYVFGGYWDNFGNYQNNVFKFYDNGNYGTFEELGVNLPVKSDTKTIRIGADVYILGGTDTSNNDYTGMVKFNLQTHQLTTLSSPPFALGNNGGVVEYKGNIMIIQGSNVAIYDIVNDTWTLKNMYPDNFLDASIFNYKGIVYVYDGKSLYKYIENKDEWLKIVDVSNYKTINIGIVVIGDSVYNFSRHLSFNKKLNPTGGVWNTNEFAGAYVYISSGTGVGSLRYITRNDGYTLYVSGWDAYPTEGSGYVIYDRLGNNFLIPYNGGVLKYDGTTAEPEYVFDGTNVKGMVVWDGRLWYENKNKIFYSGAGDYYYFSAMDNLVMLDDINNMKPLGSNMLITSTTNMYLITKFVQGGNTFYSLKEVYSENGIKNRGGIVFHQGGVYVLGSDNNLYAFNLQNYGNGEVKVVLNDLGITPSNFLKEHSQSDIQLYSDGNNLYIYTTEGEAYELVYLKRYEGYINNKYGVNIKKKVLLENTLYYLGDGYIGIKGGDKDIDKNINMKISANMFVNNVFQWADVKVLNILLGNKGKPQKGILKFTHQIANRKNTYVFDLSNTGYLSDIDDITNNNIVGGNIVGMGNNGGDVISNISDIDIIKIPLDKSGQLFNIDVENTNGEELIFGGVQIYYNSISPLLHTYKNIL